MALAVVLVAALAGLMASSLLVPGWSGVHPPRLWLTLPSHAAVGSGMLWTHVLLAFPEYLEGMHMPNVAGPSPDWGALSEQLHRGWVPAPPSPGPLGLNARPPKSSVSESLAAGLAQGKPLHQVLSESFCDEKRCMEACSDTHVRELTTAPDVIYYLCS